MQQFCSESPILIGQCQVQLHEPQLPLCYCTVSVKLLYTQSFFCPHTTRTSLRKSARLSMFRNPNPEQSSSEESSTRPAGSATLQSRAASVDKKKVTVQSSNRVPLSFHSYPPPPRIPHAEEPSFVLVRPFVRLELPLSHMNRNESISSGENTLLGTSLTKLHAQNARFKHGTARLPVGLRGKWQAPMDGTPACL